MSNVLSKMVYTTIYTLSPGLARLYDSNPLIRTTILFWLFMPLTFMLWIVFGGSVISWIPAFFISSILIRVAEGTQGKERSELVLPSTQVVQGKEPIIPPSVPPSTPTVTVPEKIVDCKTCGGTGLIDDGASLCVRCGGYGKIRIVPKGTMRTLGSTKGKGSSATSLEYRNKIYMLMFVTVGIVVMAIGSKVPLIGQYIALSGLGILLVGVWVFKKKPQIASTVTKT